MQAAHSFLCLKIKGGDDEENKRFTGIFSVFHL